MIEQQLAPRVLPRGDGPTYRVVTDLVTFIATGQDTGGAYSLFETRTQPGGGVPTHLQHQEDESFYVLEGSYRFELDGDAVVVNAGGYVMVPRGTPHSFHNAGDTDARMLVQTVPGGYHEHFFAEAGDAVVDAANPGEPAGPPDIERIVAAGARYGIEFQLPADEE